MTPHKTPIKNKYSDKRKVSIDLFMIAFEKMRNDLETINSEKEKQMEEKWTQNTYINRAIMSYNVIGE